LRNVAPVAKPDRRQRGGARLDQRLAEIEGEAGPEQHQRDPDRDVIDARQAADRGMQRSHDRT
jgi:hypothetical protein